MILFRLSDVWDVTGGALNIRDNLPQHDVELRIRCVTLRNWWCRWHCRGRLWRQRLREESGSRLVTNFRCDTAPAISSAESMTHHAAGPLPPPYDVPQSLPPRSRSCRHRFSAAGEDIRDRKDVNLGSELMVGLLVGFITGNENPSGGLRQSNATDAAQRVFLLPIMVSAALSMTESLRSGRVHYPPDKD